MQVRRDRQPQRMPATTGDQAERGVPLQISDRRFHRRVQRGADIRAQRLIAERPQQTHRLRRRAHHVVAQHRRRRHPAGVPPLQVGPPHPPSTIRPPHTSQLHSRFPD
jgi:hypothetical protein